ncbi:MAG TPA: hypothetical protein VMI31_07810 [Fimbriimonadaceae bacterium]|nr:hypothetical protein [Fimbriimonadaceae bacterium]
MRSVGLFALLLLASLLIGYGFLPIFASETTSQDHLVGGSMVAAGAVMVLYVVLNARARPR